jgi:hypothetical protein
LQKGVRNTVIVLGLVAMVIYVGFILMMRGAGA